jgi:hypothetical protein
MNGFLAFFTRLETLVDKMCHVVKVVAPAVQTFAPLAGPDGVAIAAGAGLSLTLATAVDKAIEDHQTAVANGVPEADSAAAASITIAQAVAASGAVDSTTAAKITQITSLMPQIGLHG